ncbi:MAG: universal stress protein [Acidobacteriaceae bacterium]
MSTSQLRGWASPRRILLATDLTDLGFTLPVAKQQALAYKAELRIVHILPDPNAPLIDPVLMVNCDPARTQKSAETKLEKVVAETQAAGTRSSFHLVAGDTVQEIIKLSGEWKADRLIASTHGKAKFHLHILGSIAESLFHRIDVPVLAVGPKVVPGKNSVRRHMRIVFAASLDHDSRRMAEFALSVAEAHGADIALLHVLPNVVPCHPTTGPVRANANRMLEDLVTVRHVSKSRPVCEVVYGQPTESILAYAKQHAADMIVLGASAHSAFDARFIPGTAYRVLCESPCPVLVLKHESAWHSVPIHSTQDKNAHLEA